MSVPVSKRGISDLEFYKNAIRLRKEMTNLLLRDFGIKPKVRNPIIKIGQDTAEAEEIKKLIQENNVSITDEYPMWLIDHFRTKMINIMSTMVLNIRMANSIYPNSNEEFYERRLHQDRSIGNCEQLLEMMQYAMDIFPIDAQKLMRYVEMIDRERLLLKGWRKSDNKAKKRLQ